jgi:hypothetical protein
MILAILFTVAGSIAAVAPTQWRNGHWLASGRWVVRRVSPHAVAGAPAAGAMLASIGWMLVWPPAVVVAIVAASWWLWRMRASARAGGAGLPPTLRRGPVGVDRGSRVARPRTLPAGLRRTSHGTHRRGERAPGESHRRGMGA